MLCRGDPEQIVPWLQERSTWPLHCLVALVLGTGLYGFTVGLWRAPLQGLYTALKLPLLLLSTMAGTGLVNGMLAQLLGSGMSWRQSASAVLMSFTVAALILGALSPVTLFLLYNAPPPESGGFQTAYRLTLLAHVACIAVAGCAANLRLYRVLQTVTAKHRAALHILVSWLATNLLLGSQFSWILRPFVGSPDLPVQFIRPNAFQGSFFESVGRSVAHLITATGR
jgi:hypothetical protein